MLFSLFAPRCLRGLHVYSTRLSSLFSTLRVPQPNCRPVTPRSSLRRAAGAGPYSSASPLDETAQQPPCAHSHSAVLAVVRARESVHPSGNPSTTRPTLGFTRPVRKSKALPLRPAGSPACRPSHSACRHTSRPGWRRPESRVSFSLGEHWRCLRQALPIGHQTLHRRVAEVRFRSPSGECFGGVSGYTKRGRTANSCTMSPKAALRPSIRLLRPQREMSVRGTTSNSIQRQPRARRQCARRPHTGNRAAASVSCGQAGFAGRRHPFNSADGAPSKVRPQMPSCSCKWCQFHAFIQSWQQPSNWSVSGTCPGRPGKPLPPALAITTHAVAPLNN